MASPASRSIRFRPLVALTGVALAVGLSSCSGTTGGEQGPVDVSTNTPAAGQAPALGSSTTAGVTVAGAALHRSGSSIAVSATVTTDHPDRLVSVSSNYTSTTTLPRPLAVSPGSPTSIGPATAVLRPSGPIDDGATVAVSFTFATAGTVQVYATYKA